MRYHCLSRQKVFSALIATLIAFLIYPLLSQASSIDDLKKEIEQKNEEIRKLEEEAKKYREQIAQKQQIGKTLNEELKRIERTIGKLKRDIVITQQKIQKTKLEIDETSFEIQEKETSIKRLKSGLGGLIEALAEKDQESLVEVLMKQRVLSDFFSELDYFEMLENKILASLDTIRSLKKELETKKAQAEDKKEEFEDLQRAFNNQKKIQEGVRRERSELLKITKNQEKEYQKLLREREARRIALEEEIREIEAKIKFTLDPSSLPSKGSGVLGWPLPDISLASCWKGGQDAKNCLTQYFGYTSFAAIGGYNGKGHNGTDFRAEYGTSVFSASDGEIAAIGDTDDGCRGASYGKWILIRHPNNLSTLYAHLSAINVSAGQQIRRGEIIAYSGKSGYATGPHLHFSVFAAPAVRIESIRSRVCGRLMTLPIAAINGYLNPLDYL